MIDYPNKLNVIFKKLDKFHIKPIIIGGYIRDKLLKITSSDIDIELYGIDSLFEIEKILEEFGKVTSVGKSFGVCKLFFEELELDFSLPRKDSKIASGHKGIKVNTDKNLDFKTASTRRDFTINAIGYDVKKKQILDPFHGQKDLKKKILRAVDLSKFSEDPLRILRALVFASRFHFTIEKQLFLECKNMICKNLLQELPRERIFNEIEKLLLKSKQPSYGFSLLKEIGGFNFFYEFSTISDAQYRDTLLSLDLYNKLSNLDKDIKISSLLALLVYHFTQNNRETFLDKITLHISLRKKIALFIETSKELDIQNINDYKLYLLAQKVKLKDFVVFLQALYPQNKIIIKINIEQRAKELHIFFKALPPLIQGKDLIHRGIKPSKKFSEILKKGYDIQLQRKLQTKEEIFEYLLKEKIID